MIAAAARLFPLRGSSPPAARQSAGALSFHGARAAFQRRPPAAPPHSSAQPSSSFSFRPSKLAPSGRAGALRHPSAAIKFPQAAPSRNSAPSCPRFRPWEAFERQPRVQAAPSRKGPASETLV